MGRDCGLERVDKSTVDLAIVHKVGEITPLRVIYPQLITVVLIFVIAGNVLLPTRLIGDDYPAHS